MLAGLLAPGYLLFLAVASIVSLGHASAADERPTESAVFVLSGPGLPSAIADFDGDQRPDLANVSGVGDGSSGSGYWIELQLSALGPRRIHLTAPSGGLAIEARDVNGDRMLDLVVRTARFGQPVAILLNNGRGNFSLADPLSYPSIFNQTHSGWADSSYYDDAAAGAPPQLRYNACSDASRRSDGRSSVDLALRSELNPVTNFCFTSSPSRAPPIELTVL